MCFILGCKWRLNYLFIKLFPFLNNATSLATHCSPSRLQTPWTSPAWALARNFFRLRTIELLAQIFVNFISNSFLANKKNRFILLGSICIHSVPSNKRQWNIVLKFQAAAVFSRPMLRKHSLLPVVAYASHIFFVNDSSAGCIIHKYPFEEWTSDNYLFSCDWQQVGRGLRPSRVCMLVTFWSLISIDSSNDISGLLWLSLSTVRNNSHHPPCHGIKRIELNHQVVTFLRLQRQILFQQKWLAADSALTVLLFVFISWWECCRVGISRLLWKMFWNLRNI